MKRAFLVGLGCAGVVLAAWSCGGSNPSGFDNDAGVDGGDDGPSNDDGNVFHPTDGGGDGNPSCATHCSSDLHSVLDCNDTVLTTCPGDQGCAGNTCVPACDSAKANKTTIGCDYYTVAPETGTGYNWHGNCFAAFVANTWGAPITLGLERGGQTLNIGQAARIPSGNGKAITYGALPNGQLPPGQVAIVFLSQAPSGTLSPCPVTPAVNVDPAQHGTGVGQAFHITTSAPVVAYDIYPYGGGNSAITSATLLLPTTAWDGNYVAVDAYKTVPSTWSLPWSVVVAQEDATDVTISPTAAILAGGSLAGTGKGVPKTYSLNKGQYLQFVQSEELIGSPIQATKPVGFFGGITCMDVPTNAVACDGAHQQLPPVKALGSVYVGVRHRNRYAQEETPPWRLVGAVDGTTLKWEPSTPNGAPTALAAGQMVEFAAAGPFVVKSQDASHPFYVAQYMTGCSAAGTGDCRGDPEFVNVVPALQYLDSYVFFTDPTYPETSVVVVRKKAKDNTFKDVSLDCAGNLTGWAPVGSSAEYEFTRQDLVTGNFAKVGNCDNGRHEMKSAAPFGVTVWGWGSSATTGFSTQAVSYGYPAGMSVQPINTVVVPPTPK